VETVTHVLIDSPKLRGARQELRGKLEPHLTILAIYWEEDLKVRKVRRMIYKAVA
jgi:hypothetical protein